MARRTLTTTDNPFNPFTQYDMWRGWDESLCRYNSNQYLASVAPWSSDLTEEEDDLVLDRAFEEIERVDIPIFNPLTGERVHYVCFTEE